MNLMSILKKRYSELVALFRNTIRKGWLRATPDSELAAQMETDVLLSIPGMRESLTEAEADIAAGRTLTIQQSFPMAKHFERS